MLGVVVPARPGPMWAVWRGQVCRVLWGSRVPAVASRLQSTEPDSFPAPRCWSCGIPFPARGVLPRFCPACQALQPPQPQPDLFRLMGCDCSFNIDVQQLQQRFRSLQRSLHPDYFSQRSQKERDFSEQHSSLVNRAYQTLLSPLSRGLYLLELNGVELAEGTDRDIDVEFLKEIMEINEILAESKNEAKIEEIESFIEVKQEELTNGVSNAFERGDLQEAKKLLAKMKYFENLEEKVKSKKNPS
ncbi:iron-sulfur cluster co-chaperone protein HscB isoform X2 [Emydura macquarii macquarii]|uniref:iron-sulfur cluster co-chaperone protein HscB isoform X2 n=1 Tax=Emydura macquarii macquarii TaxID=1129001 RepID=UPI00352A83F4